jgi:ferredoxin
MPQLTVEGVGTFEVPQGKRLVLALVDEAGVDQLHACGGNARCTTCRVEFVSGEPELMTAAEKSVLTAKGLTGVRLSCQITCDHDMTVRAISRFAGSGRKDSGKRPEDAVQPQPVDLVPKQQGSITKESFCRVSVPSSFLLRCDTLGRSIGIAA